MTQTGRSPTMKVVIKEVFAMLKPMKNNKKYICWLAVTGLLGIGGLLLTPFVICLIKLLNRYPKAFRWIVFTAFVLIGIYGILFERKWNMSFLIIYIGMVIAVSDILDTKCR